MIVRQEVGSNRGDRLFDLDQFLGGAGLQPANPRRPAEGEACSPGGGPLMRAALGGCFVWLCLFCWQRQSKDAVFFVNNFYF